MSFLCNHRCFDRHKEVLAHRMRTMVEIIRAVGDVEELHLCRNLFLGALALVCSTRKWLPAQPRHNPPTSPLAQFQFHACGSVSTRGVLAIRAFLATGNSIWIWSAGLSFLVLARLIKVLMMNLIMAKGRRITILMTWSPNRCCCIWITNGVCWMPLNQAARSTQTVQLQSCATILW